MTHLIDGDWEYEVDWKDLTFEALPQHNFRPELKLKGFKLSHSGTIHLIQASFPN